MQAMVFLYWIFMVITAVALNSITISEQNDNAESSSHLSQSTAPVCNNNCTGSADVFVFLTGTQVIVDPASTTGPPDCNLQATTLGPGYTLKQATSILYQDIDLSYDFECGTYTTGTWTSYVTFTTITKDLAQFNGHTIACLIPANSIINGYYSKAPYESHGGDLVTSKYVTLATPIILGKGGLSTTALNNRMTDRIFSQMATTTCEKEVTESRTDCWSESSLEVDFTGVWIGVPLTYDASQITKQPNCFKPLQYLGSGYTGSNTYTTITSSAGYVQLRSTSNTLMNIVPPQITDPIIESGFMIIDFQTIGCLTSLYYVAQSYSIVTEYHSCFTTEYDSYNDSYTSQVIRLPNPVTDTGQMPFVVTVNGHTSLIPQLMNQIITTPNPTLLVTPTMASANTTSSLSPSFTLIQLGNSNAGLSGATKIILIAVVVFAAALILGFFAFFVWRRCYVDQCKKRKIVHNSSATKDSKHVQRKKSWRAPLLMITGFVSGLAFALAHHFFYNWVGQQQVEDVNISQSWILRLGNLLAFAVRLSLSISASVAFVQLQWAKLRQHSVKMKDIDTLSGILANVLSFGHISVWFQYPGLLSIAIICWLLPILPVITPGTIIVVPQAYEELTQLQVPQLAVNPSIWGGNDTQEPIALSKIMISSAMLGEILPMKFNYTNATYHLDFLGPAVQCSVADKELTANLSHYFQVLLIEQEVDKSTFYTYSAWVGGEDIYDYHSSHCGTDDSNLDVTSQDHARLYIMTDDGTESEANVTECSLYNATYHVDFSFEATEQDVSVRSVDYLNGIPFNQPVSSSQDPDYENHVLAYSSLMTVFGSLLVGAIKNEESTIYRNCTSITYINTGLDFTSKLRIRDNAESLKQFQNSIEQVFRNATLSLMSKSAFIKDSSTASFIPVNITTTLNVYQYNSFDLILSYAIGLVITLICCLIGFRTFMINQGSYQNIFTTFIRATKHAELVIEDEDTGADPCPHELRQASIKLTSNATSTGSRLPSDPVEQQHLIPRKPVAIHREVSDG